MRHARPGREEVVMGGQEELEIEIGPAGEVRVHVKGSAGPSCLEYLEIFREVLGPVTEQRLTPEFYQAETHVQVQQRGHHR
ncbi:MAG TPA: DUF2997 domain-containing protein [Armatimonadota bacterium]|nr:DUF2997 domain-containing protein [Armatimonadota bacterium]